MMKETLPQVSDGSTLSMRGADAAVHTEEVVDKRFDGKEGSKAESDFLEMVGNGGAKLDFIISASNPSERLSLGDVNVDESRLQ